jgi:hypothetical protein
VKAVFCFIEAYRFLAIKNIIRDFFAAMGRQAMADQSLGTSDIQ